MELKFLLGLALFCAIAVYNGNGQIISCYYTNWAQYRPEPMTYFPEDIDPTLCTHFFFAFAYMANNQLIPYEWNDEEMWGRFHTHIKGGNPTAKTLLAVGGWNFPLEEMHYMLATPENRTQFVTTSITNLRNWGFDGLDLDFEYPGAADRCPNCPPGADIAGDKQRFTLLCQELRAAFEAETPPAGKERLLLTAAVGAGKARVDEGYEVALISQELDIINLMSYDLHGAWEDFTGINAPLYPRADEVDDQALLNVDWATNYWLELGADINKLVIGMATYGRCFTLADPNQNGMAAPTTGPCLNGTYTREAGFLAYYEVCPYLLAGTATREFHPEHLSPYAYQNDQWIGYDDMESLTQKIAWLKEGGYAGYMVWAPDLDDWTGTACEQGTYPLLKHLKNEYESGTTVDPGSTTTVDGTTGDGTTTTPAATTTTEDVTTTTPGGDFTCDGKANGMYPHPVDCTHFYTCSNGIASESECAPGTIFNPDTTICDYPENVDRDYVCGKCPEVVDGC